MFLGSVHLHPTRRHIDDARYRVIELVIENGGQVRTRRDLDEGLGLRGHHDTIFSEDGEHLDVLLPPAILPAGLDGL